MAAYAFETVDVFTTTRFGGNPLAVLTDARGLDTEAMQRIAREFNLSETAFVLPPEDPAHTARVRIFTPAREIPFAGHPNVGTALVLAAGQAARPDTMIFDEAAGLVHVRFDWSSPAARAIIDAPQSLSLGETIPPETIAACAGLELSDVLTGTHPPLVAGCGLAFAVAEVRPESLSGTSLNLGAMHEASGRHRFSPLGFALYLHARTPGGRRARMFDPLAGIPEDPATGSAAVALAALLLSVIDAPTLDLEIEQGVEMGRPSLLYAGARRAPDGIRASVGGSAVPVMRGVIEV